MYLEDGFVQRLTGALDGVLAPVFSSLDNLNAYVDPELAPEDFLQWLGGWVGVALDESWPLERRRSLVAAATDLYRVRGTARGLAAHLRLLTGAEVEIEETGGTAWSTAADPQPPGSPNFAMVVRLRSSQLSKADLPRLDALVAASKPAHVVHRVELVPPGDGQAGGEPPVVRKPSPQTSPVEQKRVEEGESEGPVG